MPIFLYTCRTTDCPSKGETEHLLPSHASDAPLCPGCWCPLYRLIAGPTAYSLKGDANGWGFGGYGATERGMQAVSDKANKGDKVVSFPGQRHKGRSGA